MKPEEKPVDPLEIWRTLEINQGGGMDKYIEERKENEDAQGDE